MNTKLHSLTKFTRLDNLPGTTRKQLRDLVGAKMFDAVFSETVSVKQTNAIIESFVDSIIEVASDGRSAQRVIETMNKINPALAKHVFEEDSDNTGGKTMGGTRAFVVTYIDSDNEEHTIDQQAISPRSIRRRMEANGFQVKDIVIAATGESVLDETISRRTLTKLAENILADIDHLTSNAKNESTMFGRHITNDQISAKQAELARLIEKGDSIGIKWDNVKKKFISNRPKKSDKSNKISLSDVFKK